MKCWRQLLLCALAMLVGGCGSSVRESLKVAPTTKVNVGDNRAVVILPFADYSYADNLETAFRRNMFVNECIIDHFVRLGFHLPIQEDVFYFLAEQNIINVSSYNPQKTKSLQLEMEKEWSPSMKNVLQGYIDATQEQDQQSEVGGHHVHTSLYAQLLTHEGRFQQGSLAVVGLEQFCNDLLQVFFF